MKHLKYPLLALLCFSLAQVSFAQEKEVERSTRERIYTPAQIEMIKAQRKLIKENKEAFHKTLSEKQKAVLKNKGLTRQTKREALMKILSKKQKVLLAANKAKAKALREKFRATITEKQRQALKERREKLREKRDKLHKERRKRSHGKKYYHKRGHHKKKDSLSVN